MNESTRKGIIYLVFAVTCVWGYFNLFGKPQSTSSPQPVLVPAATLSPTTAAAIMDTTVLAQLRNSDWGDDPFKKGSTAMVDAPQTAEHNFSPQWNLSGIVYSPKDPLAIINGKMVRVGDIIEDAKVTKIEKKKVTLDYSGSSMTLTVNKG
jgi:type II secretory pathway component PulC